MNITIKNDVLVVEGQPPIAAQIPISDSTMAILYNTVRKEDRVIDLNVYCEGCGLGLCALSKGQLGAAGISEVRVPPCPRCLGIRL